ncbi:MAG: hypothetical protein FJZ58_07830 [Chlamydiae bacterium]|nr:hypothetical protein [Chlamydiota bacterium]
MTTFPIPWSSIEKEGVLHTSKPLKQAVLLTMQEMEDLFREELSPFFLISASGLVKESSWNIGLEDFFLQYHQYLEWMKQDKGLPANTLRNFFSLMLSASLDVFYAIKMGPEKCLIKPRLPIIQIQMYHCFFSLLDHKMYPMVIHPNSFAFGLQFSYPQIYEDPHTHQYAKVLQEERFPNTPLFKALVSWMRRHTKPVILKAHKAMPFRIGKNAEHLLESHLGLQSRLS